jgi:hypothetical protein
MMAQVGDFAQLLQAHFAGGLTLADLNEIKATLSIEDQVQPGASRTAGYSTQGERRGTADGGGLCSVGHIMGWNDSMHRASRSIRTAASQCSP